VTGIILESQKVQQKTHPPLCKRSWFGKINIEQDTIPFYVSMHRALSLLIFLCVCGGVCYYGNTSAISRFCAHRETHPCAFLYRIRCSIHQTHTSQRKNDLFGCRWPIGALHISFAPFDSGWCIKERNPNPTHCSPMRLSCLRNELSKLNWSLGDIK
jgi:hypothetical protein